MDNSVDLVSNEVEINHFMMLVFLGFLGEDIVKVFDVGGQNAGAKLPAKFSL